MNTQNQSMMTIHRLKAECFSHTVDYGLVPDVAVIMSTLLVTVLRYAMLVKNGMHMPNIFFINEKIRDNTPAEKRDKKLLVYQCIIGEGTGHVQRVARRH